jgi:hypothetical protein
VLVKAHVLSGMYQLNFAITDRNRIWVFFAFRNKEETTGTYVKQKYHCSTNAKLKVIAIGLNIFLQYQIERRE